MELPEAALHAHNKTVTTELDCCLYQVGLALLVSDQRKLYFQHDCSSVIQYAVNWLEMSRQKASELLRVMRELVKLPLLHEAFRIGALRWGKMREITRVATPENEGELLEFALKHTTDQVADMVTVSPRAYRQSQRTPEPELLPSETVAGGNSSHETPRGQPPAGGEPGPCECDELFPDGAISRSCGAPSVVSNDVNPAVFPAQPRIKVVFELSPEQFARYERVEERIHQQLGRRVSRNEVLMKLLDSNLTASSVEGRAKFPVIVCIDGRTGAGHYQTRRGPLPATQAQVERALAEAVEVLGPNRSLRRRPPKSRRTDIPRSLMRALWARSGGRCEKEGCCNGAPFEVHHPIPISKGGKNTLANTRLYCKPCHALEHQEDFKPDQPWHQARSANQGRKKKFFKKRDGGKSSTRRPRLENESSRGRSPA